MTLGKFHALPQGANEVTLKEMDKYPWEQTSQKNNKALSVFLIIVSVV